MFFPWKKTKGKKFSQIVTNHRDASLMLETGFPASLADLFVKNRNRFNNPNTGNSNGNSKTVNSIAVNNKRKKKKKKPIISPLVAPVTFPDSGPTQFWVDLPTPSSGLSSGSESSLPRLRGEVVVVDDVGIDDVVVDGRCVLVAVLKMFFVVILALGVKRFAVGIALSAFFMLFMEYVSRRMGGLLSTFSSCLIGSLKKHKQLFRLCYKEAPIEENKSDCDLAYSEVSSGNSYNTDDLVSEIRVFSQTSSPIRETSSDDSEFNLRNSNEKQEMHIYPSKLLLSDGNKAARKKSKIGSKIKKLANKLNGSKSKKKNKSKYDTFGSSRTDNTIDQGKKERESAVESNEESTSSFPSSSGVSSDDDRVNLEDLIYIEDSKKISKNCNEIAEEGGSKKKSLSGGYLAILVIVVLAGLVMGRALALAFSVSWFVILKFKSGTKGRS